RLYSMSSACEKGGITPDLAIRLLDAASMLDPDNVDIYMRKYAFIRQMIKKEKGHRNRKLLKKELHILKKCVNLCPTVPEYHFYYALTLKIMSPEPNDMTRGLILSELEKAYSLKPNSDFYRKIYEKYSKSLHNTA
ncbi:MAG: hypothetical protein ABH883_09070, partial [Candidatus Omnitrophota bacterium]